MADSNNRIYRHIIRNTGFFGGVQVLSLLASLVRNKFAAVLLGPVGLGFMSIYNTVVKFISEASNLGIGFSAVRQVSASYADGDLSRVRPVVDTVRVWSLLTGLAGTALCCVLSPLLSKIGFDTLSRWPDFLWLSPVVGLTVVTGGEMAILKGVRRLRQVGVCSLINALAGVAIAFPFFYCLGRDGIVPALAVSALAVLVTVFFHSFRIFPFRLDSPLRGCLKRGRGMLRLGLAFLGAGVLGSGVELAIRSYISHSGTMADVGLYNAAYVLTVTYASVVFMSMETDYFPRLSSVNQDSKAANALVNRQIEASLLLLAPLLAAFLVLLPVIIPLIYSSAFMEMIDMARFGVLAMLLRAMILPMEYLSLAKGRSGVYLLTEAAYDVFVAAAVMVGYSLDGLRGMGIGLLAAAVFNCLLDWTVCYAYYRFVMSRKAFGVFLLQLPVLVGAFVVTGFFDGIAYWTWGVACVAVSAAVSVISLVKIGGG